MNNEASDPIDNVKVMIAGGVKSSTMVDCNLTQVGCSTCESWGCFKGSLNHMLGLTKRVTTTLLTNMTRERDMRASDMTETGADGDKNEQDREKTQRGRTEGGGEQNHDCKAKVVDNVMDGRVHVKHGRQIKTMSLEQLKCQTSNTSMYMTHGTKLIDMEGERKLKQEQIVQVISKLRGVAKKRNRNKKETLNTSSSEADDIVINSVLNVWTTELGQELLMKMTDLSEDEAKGIGQGHREDDNM